MGSFNLVMTAFEYYRAVAVPELLSSHLNYRCSSFLSSFYRLSSSFPSLFPQMNTYHSMDPTSLLPLPTFSRSDRA